MCVCMLTERGVRLGRAEVPDGRSLTQKDRQVSERSANHRRSLCE